MLPLSLKIGVVDRLQLAHIERITDAISQKRRVVLMMESILKSINSVKRAKNPTLTRFCQLLQQALIDSNCLGMQSWNVQDSSGFFFYILQYPGYTLW